MGLFVIECPKCGNYAQASKFFNRKVQCSCGYEINVSTDSMSAKLCPHCKNMVIFDQAKGEKAICPVCKEKINPNESRSNTSVFHCPSCSCELIADKNANTFTCPLCDTVIDVQQQTAKEKIKSQGAANLIKFEGPADSIVWKHPIEDFNLGSQLIVHESQEAVFFRNGKALDIFGSGRYTLETQKLPMMDKLYQLPSGSDATFHSEVYYINLVSQLAVKWGLNDKINFIDPLTEAPISLGARGILNFRVSNSRKLLDKLVGTTSGLTRQDLMENPDSNIRNYFRSVIQIAVSTNLAQTITDNNIDILQIDMHRMVLSNALLPLVLPYFEDYGLTVTQFLVEGIALPERGELGYDALQTILKLRQQKLTKTAIETETSIKMAEMEAKKQLDIRIQENAAQVEIARRSAMSEKGESDILQAQLEGQKNLAATSAEVAAERLRMQLEMERKAQQAQIEVQEMRGKGYTQKDVIQGQVMTAFAENQGQGGGIGAGGMGISGMAGEAMSMGVNFAAMGTAAGMAANMIGTGLQAGKAMAGTMTDGMNSVFSPSAGWNCTCGQTNITTGFCPNCGSKKPEAVIGWTCPSCGKAGITTNFCPDCGGRKPEQPAGWTCTNCGMANIVSNFCPQCGSKKPDMNAGWTCTNCGTADIKTGFCPNCGKAKEN